MAASASPDPVRTLASVAVVGGLSCIFASAFPANPDSPVELLRVAGVAVLAASAALWRIGERLPAWGVHAAVAASTIAISLVIARSATGVGMIVTASAYLWIAVYAGFFFTRRAAQLHVALIASAFGCALLAASEHVPAAAWWFICLSLLVTVETLTRQSERLRHEAHTDPLTGALNRKGLAIASERIFHLAERTGIPLTLALVDLDGFKAVNDRDGHPAGDKLLAAFSRVWRDQLEPSDVFARMGGDEFLVIVVGSNRLECHELFDRMRDLAPAPWSAGIVERIGDDDLATCLDSTDDALYREKRSRSAVREEHDPVARRAPLAPSPF